MSKVVGEKVRMADAETAELIEIKELAWLARDGVGLERNALNEGLNAKALSAATQKKASDLRGRRSRDLRGDGCEPVLRSGSGGRRISERGWL